MIFLKVLCYQTVNSRLNKKIANHEYGTNSSNIHFKVTILNRSTKFGINYQGILKDKHF